MLNFKAGQYLILKINDQARLYSIFSPENIKDFFELMVKIIPGGLASNYFISLKTGDKVNFQGPAGVFSLRENQKDKFFFATFAGIAPLRSMVASYLEKNKMLTRPKLILFWGLRNFSDICLLEELKQLVKTSQQFQFFICLSREADLSKIKSEDKKYFKLGRINICWEQFITATIKQGNNVTPLRPSGYEGQAMKQFINNFDYYLCGSCDVTESLKQYFFSKGVDKETVFFEKF